VIFSRALTGAGFQEKSMLNLARRTADLLRMSLAYAVALMLCMIVILVFAQVVARYVTHSSTFAIAEICRILLIWLVFTGAALLVSQRKLILIDFVHGRMAGRSSHLLHAITDIVTVVFLVAFGVYTVELMQVAKFKTAPATGLSYWWFYTAPLLFCILGVFFTLERVAFGSSVPAHSHGLTPDGVRMEP
jgi:TRAP-type C4-dicarboxylate transport system permease small subunit